MALTRFCGPMRAPEGRSMARAMVSEPNLISSMVSCIHWAASIGVGPLPSRDVSSAWEDASIPGEGGVSTALLSASVPAIRFISLSYCTHHIFCMFQGYKSQWSRPSLPCSTGQEDIPSVPCVLLPPREIFPLQPFS